jgi:hypothetical protein
MSLVDFRPALEGDPADDTDLRYLLRMGALQGEIRLSYEREPSYWASVGMEGPMHQMMIARIATEQKDAGRAVGMGSRSIRSLYVNGEVTPVGYLSQLRVDSDYAWGVALPRALTKGWRFIRQLHQDGRTPYYLVSLVAGDSVAWRMMTLGLPDWPTLTAVGGLLTYGIAVQRARSVPRLTGGLRLRRATEQDRAPISECLTRNNRRRQFAPMWEAPMLGDARWTPDLSLQDFWIVERGTQVVGTLARWNQRRFKQQVVRGYSEAWLGMRPLINIAARLGLAPRLPALGEQVRLTFASHLAVDNDDPQVAAALLASVYNDAVKAGDDYLMLGLDSEHSFTRLVRRYRRVVYATQLFLATWDDEVELARQMDGRQMGAEIAVL